MKAPLNQVISPASFQELFSAWNRFPDAVLFAGGTNLISKQDKNILYLPPVFLSLDKIEELQKITRTEQYLEIGSMVKLNRLIKLGKIVPEVLCLCLEKIAGTQLRNIATIGGNICATSLWLDLHAPLTA
ncbi:MAG: FAD binding domain-containing protein, partial [Treponema sp.]|nr:FAD binding domain-containing protein [Treponema sp.]